MSREPPRFVTWILRRAVPDDVVGASIAGDLHEEFERRAGSPLSFLWYTLAATGIAGRYAFGRVLDAMLQKRRGSSRHAVPPRQAAPPRRHRRSATRDVQDAWRGLRRRPLFTLAGMALLACGLAASSTVFSFIEAVLLRPLPLVPHDERVLRIRETVAHPQPGQAALRNVLPADMADIASAAPSIASTAAMVDGFTIPFHGPNGAARVRAVRATSGFFAVMGVQPALGRPFTGADEKPGAESVALLSHGAWQRWFGGDTDAVGSVITVNYRPYVVIGVMPRGFTFPDRPELYLPIRQGDFTNRFHVNIGLARLRPGATLDRAQVEVDAAIAALAVAAPEAGHGSGASVQRWRDAATERVRPALRILAVAAALVLLLTTLNIGGLLAERLIARQREIAVRRSLGATRGSIARLLLSEGVLLSLGGALLGLALTALTLRLVVALSPADLPFRDTVHVDGSVLAFTATLAVVCGLCAGFVPTFAARQHTLLHGERSGGSGTTGSSALVVAQIAIAMVLVVGAGLLTRSFVAALRVDPGVRTEGVFTAQVTLPTTRYRGDVPQLAFFRALLDSIRAVPGVTGAEVSVFAPLRGALPMSFAPLASRDAPERLMLNAVSPGFLPMLHVPLLEGRWFTTRDDERGQRVALLSRLAARRLFPGESPVGRILVRPTADDGNSPNGSASGVSQTAQGERYRVIGVVGDVRQSGLLEDEEPLVYFPFRQFPFNAGTIIVSGQLSSTTFTRAVRSIVRRLDPVLPLDRIGLLASMIDESLAQPRFYSVIVGVFGVLALGLSVCGLYAVVAFAARRRLFEFGVRSALGARPVDNLWLVFKLGMRLSVLGVALGLVIAVATSHVLRALLYHTEPNDPLLLALAAGVTLGIALAAVGTPALRAARADPVETLRAE